MGKPVIRKEEQGKMGLREMEKNEEIGTNDTSEDSWWQTKKRNWDR